MQYTADKMQWPNVHGGPKQTKNRVSTQWDFGNFIKNVGWTDGSMVDFRPARDIMKMVHL